MSFFPIHQGWKGARSIAGGDSLEAIKSLGHFMILRENLHCCISSLCKRGTVIRPNISQWMIRDIAYLVPPYLFRVDKKTDNDIFDDCSRVRSVEIDCGFKINFFVVQRESRPRCSNALASGTRVSKICLSSESVLAQFDSIIASLLFDSGAASVPCKKSSS